MFNKQLSEALRDHACSMDGLTEHLKKEFEWRRSHSEFATKQDLKKLENKMSALSEEFKKVKEDIIEGTTELSARIKALEDAGGVDTLSPEARTEWDAIKAAATTLASIVPNPPTTPETPA